MLSGLVPELRLQRQVAPVSQQVQRRRQTTVSRLPMRAALPWTCSWPGRWRSVACPSCPDAAAAAA